MIRVWTWFIGTRVGRGCVILAALVFAFVATWFAARSKGKAAQKNADLAGAAQSAIQAANETTQATQSAARTRAEVDAASDRLPTAPAQKIATAAADTAAGKLRTDGWTRD